MKKLEKVLGESGTERLIDTLFDLGFKTEERRMDIVLASLGSTASDVLPKVKNTMKSLSMRSGDYMKRLLKVIESDAAPVALPATAEEQGWAWLKADESFVEYLVKFPDPPQAVIELAAKAMSLDIDRAGLLWRMAAVAAALLSGGDAKKKGFGKLDTNPEQHALGIEVEKEHVNEKARADIQALLRGRIALDHESENKDSYYYRASGGEAKVKGEV